MADPTIGVKTCLLRLELLDVFIVNGAFQEFLFPIRGRFLGTGISPHFTQKPRYIRVAHVGVFLLDHGSSGLRKFEKGRHGSFGCQGILLGSSLGNQTGTVPRRLFSDISDLVIPRLFIPIRPILVGQLLPLIGHKIENVLVVSRHSVLLQYLVLLQI